jgi:cobalt-precorrin-6B (C15)-methyltransferase
MIWQYKTPGIPDNLFARLPGIPLSKREVRILLISSLKMKANSIFWDIGAGTGTIPVEVGLLCPKAKIVAVERDEEVAGLIRKNCDLFQVNNVRIIEGNAPDCFTDLDAKPDRICLEGGKPIEKILEQAWEYLKPEGRIVATASNLESLYILSKGLSDLQARNIEVVQSAINRLETRGIHQTFAAVDPMFILSGEKL